MSDEILVHADSRYPHFGLLVKDHRLIRKGIHPRHRFCSTRTFNRLCREGHIVELC